MKRAALILLLLSRLSATRAEDGYRLWLRYDLLTDTTLLRSYRTQLAALQFNAATPVLSAAHLELNTGLRDLLGGPVGSIDSHETGIPDHCLLVGTPATLPAL